MGIISYTSSEMEISTVEESPGVHYDSICYDNSDIVSCSGR